jgi:hypothetical protein
MDCRPLRPILIIAVLLCTGLQMHAAKRGPIVRQLDNILIETDDPNALFNFFTETLGLPAAWLPKDSPAYTGGGVGAGNVTFELIRAASRDSHSGARVSGLAFVPYPLGDAIAELQFRKIPHDPPEPYNSVLPNGSEGILWTTVVLSDLSEPDFPVLLREYNPGFLDTEIRRMQLSGRLVLKKGGSLGVQSVKEIILGTGNLVQDRLRWRNLLMPSAPSSVSLWQAGRGPGIRLVTGARRGVQRIVIKVDSLPRARTFLRERNLLGSESGDSISINPAMIQGLAIRLVEQ